MLPSFNEKVSKGIVLFRYALEVARLGLSEEKQKLSLIHI